MRLPMSSAIAVPIFGSNPKSKVQVGASMTPSSVMNSCTTMLPMSVPGSPFAFRFSLFAFHIHVERSPSESTVRAGEVSGLTYLPDHLGRVAGNATVVHHCRGERVVVNWFEQVD